VSPAQAPGRARVLASLPDSLNWRETCV